MVCPSFTLVAPNGVDTIVANGETPDVNGTFWVPTSFAGWFDSTDVRAARSEVSPVGEVITVAHELGRALAFEALAVATPPGTDGLVTTALGDACWAATELAKLVGKCVYAPGLLTVTDPIHTLHASVMRPGKILTSVVGNLGAMRVQWQLLMPDPRRYDADDTPFD